jgi:hypothetical protein
VLGFFVFVGGLILIPFVLDWRERERERESCCCCCCCCVCVWLRVKRRNLEAANAIFCGLLLGEFFGYFWSTEKFTT